MRVADARHIHAHELELGAHVGARKITALDARDMVSSGLRHFVSWRDQAKNAATPEGAFADSVNVGIRRLAEVIDDDTTAFADFQLAITRQLILWPNTGGKQQYVGFYFVAIGKGKFVSVVLTVLDGLGIFAGVYLHAEFFDFVTQHGAAAIVDLDRHQARREFDHVC